MKFMSVAQMIAVEKEANAIGLTYPMMMENAGSSLAEVIRDIYGDLPKRSICGLIGSGNNGGDGLVAMTRLLKNGWQATACLVRPRQPDDALVAYMQAAGGQIIPIESALDFPKLQQMLESNAILLDAVLGTGFHLPLKAELAELLGYVNGEIIEMENPPYIVAVDCPSGVDCDSGQTAPEAIKADLTVTMAAVKHGLFKFPAYDLIGELRVVGIGLPDGGEALATWRDVPHFIVDRGWVRDVLPARPANAHKGTFGTTLVVAGSLAYTGAALLAGQAAYRIGAGLVTLAIPTPLHAALAGQFPEATWLLLPERDGYISAAAARIIRTNLERVTALLIGPGFGLRPWTGRFIDQLFTISDPVYNFTPTVMDADALKLLATMKDWPERIPRLSILTPHPGEMSILTGLTRDEIQANRLEIALEFSKQWGHIIVLKGAFTIIAEPEGRAAVIPVASASLARAGTGDVLAGLTAGLLGQGIKPFLAAAAAAWIHAQAGLRAADILGSNASVLASDVLNGAVGILGEIGQTWQG